MDWVDWMRKCDNWHREHYRRTVCEKCGGSGIKAIRCCSGLDCGCYGLPVEFDFCDCETPWPTAVPRPDGLDDVDVRIDENLRSIFS